MLGGGIESLPDGASIVHIGDGLSFVMPWREFRPTPSQSARIKMAACMGMLGLALDDGQLTAERQRLLDDVQAEMARQARISGRSQERGTIIPFPDRRISTANAKNGFWTDDNVAEMTRLRNTGHSASEIAKQIGAPSRNAVLAKMHRLGITDEERGGARGIGAKFNRPKKRKSHQAEPSAPVRQRAFPPSVLAEPIGFTGALPQSRNLTLLDEGFSGCRWPTMTDPDGSQRFCCDVKARGSYCAGHAAKAFERN